jgi:hypothetical protein
MARPATFCRPSRSNKLRKVTSGRIRGFRLTHPSEEHTRTDIEGTRRSVRCRSRADALKELTAMGEFKSFAFSSCFPRIFSVPTNDTVDFGGWHSYKCGGKTT